MSSIRIDGTSRQKPFRGLSLAICFVLFSACSADPGIDQGSLAGGPEAAAELVQNLEGQTSEYQWDILQDGEVSQGEFDQSVAAALSCMEDAGANVTANPVADGRGVSFGAQAPPEGEIPQDAILACSAEYYDQVGIVWSVQETIVDPERRQFDREAYRQCLVDAGLEIPSQLTAESVTDLEEEVLAEADQGLISDVQSCRDRYGYVLE